MQTPLIGYYGSKARISHHILPIIDKTKHRQYIEPFFGSGDIFFRKNKSYSEIINDKDKLIYSFFYTLKDKKLSEQLLLKLENSYFGTDEFKLAQCIAKARKSSLLNRAWACYILCDQGFLHQLEHSHMFNPDVKGSRNAPKIFLNHKKYVNENINKIRDRLQDAFIMNKDACFLLSKYGKNPDILFYVDPPYIGGKNNSYPEKLNSQEFIDTVNTAKAKIILSHSGNNILEKSLGEHFRCIEVKQYSPTNKKTRIEQIWLNFDYTPINIEQLKLSI